MRIPIVNEQDEIIGYKERNDINTEKDLIRATGLWLTDKDGNILLAQRAFVKKHDPGLWGPAVAGTVEEGETYQSNIIKEAEEEIGLTGLIFNIGPKVRAYNCIVQWFTAVVSRDYLFIKQDEEVEKIKWFLRDELEKLLEEKPEIFLKNFSKHTEIFN